MKMSDRSAFSALSFIIVVVGLTFYPGSAALALEEDHGNPGKFIENIRKGLSGLSKYFWSPKEQLPADGKEQQARGDKALAPVSKIPGVETSAISPKAAAKTIPKVVGAKPVIPSPAKASIKAPTKQKTISAKKPAGVQTIPKTAFESKTVVDRKKKMATPKTTPVQKNVTAKVSKPVSPVAPVAKIKPAQKTTRPSLKALSQPASQSKAIAQAQKNNAKQQAREKISSLVTPRPIQKKKSQALDTSKTAPAGKAVKDKKPVVSMKPKSFQKPRANKSAAATMQSMKKAIKTAPMAVMAATSPKAPKQKLVNNDKGTYIWVPNIGSQLSQRFGLTGIPAKGLAANGDLNRADGRWAFAPNKRGQLPSIYGLSGEIHAAGDAGVWVGRGRNWVYVFDKGRNYGSIVGGIKASKKAAAKPAKPVASVKPNALNAQKSGKAHNAKKPQSPNKAELKKAAKPQKGIEIKKAAKQVPSSSKNPTAAKPASKTVAKAIPGPKTARNGKWSRVNNRWVYVPQAQPGQLKPSNMTGLAEQVAKAPVTGGWVQRNNRWVYVAPRQAKAQAKARAGGRGANGSIKLQKGIAPKAIVVPNKVAKKIEPAPMKKARSKKSGIIVAQKPVAKKATSTGAKTGLAEGPDAAQIPVTKNQKIWVRKNNRWVYVFATPAAVAIAKAQQAPKVKGSHMVQNNRGPQNAQKQGNVSPTSKKPLGEFMFFVPGRTPGTGSWFIAPLQLLEQARKIKR